MRACSGTPTPSASFFVVYVLVRASSGASAPPAGLPHSSTKPTRGSAETFTCSVNLTQRPVRAGGPPPPAPARRRPPPQRDRAAGLDVRVALVEHEVAARDLESERRR